MKSVPKLIKRFVAIMLLSGFLILVFNLLLLMVISGHSTAGGSPWSTADEVAAALSHPTDAYIDGDPGNPTDGRYTLTASMAQQLQEKDVWAILIDNSTGRVVWHTDNLPDEIPMQYSIADIARLSRTYVKDYPTFTSAYSDNLVVLGFPKTSYWKAINNNWDYDFIANLPKTILFVILGNIILIFLIYMIANTRLLQSVGPILKGIEALPTENNVQVKEKGTLSEIAQYINQTSEILQTRNFELKQKETARANWIAGVSHDIRTPLSMVMGYAGQLESDKTLTGEAREKAAVICSQSIRMKNLINDLNLASKLEYNMQPIHATPFNVVSTVRQAIVDFINSDIQNKYPVEWNTDDNLTSCCINGDAALIKRAVMNLIQNAQCHNPKGCSIFVEVKTMNSRCVICVDDNGTGVDDKQLEKIKNAPHYMVCDNHALEQQHGLGLLIVQQIVAAHMGTAAFANSQHGGFSVAISIPVCE